MPWYQSRESVSTRQPPASVFHFTSPSAYSDNQSRLWGPPYTCSLHTALLWLIMWIALAHYIYSSWFNSTRLKVWKSNMASNVIYTCHQKANQSSLCCIDQPHCVPVATPTPGFKSGAHHPQPQLGPSPSLPLGCCDSAAALALKGRHFMLGPLFQSGRKLLAWRRAHTAVCCGIERNKRNRWAFNWISAEKEETESK